MTPIPPPEELLLIVADLTRPEASLVQVEPDGRIRHDPGCANRHHVGDARLAHLVLPDTASLLNAAIYGPPQHPRVRVIDPEISARSYPGHPHLYHLDVICPLFPPEKTWDWRTHNLTDYLGHVAVWLLKSQIWIATRDANDKGLWIGPEVPHDAATLLRLTARDDPCHCGSGKKYRQCHRSHDVLRFMAERPGERRVEQRGRSWCTS
jgi:hypothetical protein